MCRSFLDGVDRRVVGFSVEVKHAVSGSDESASRIEFHTASILSSPQVGVVDQRAAARVVAAVEASLLFIRLFVRAVSKLRSCLLQSIVAVVVLGVSIRECTHTNATRVSRVAVVPPLSADC